MWKSYLHSIKSDIIFLFLFISSLFFHPITKEQKKKNLKYSQEKYLSLPLSSHVSAQIKKKKKKSKGRVMLPGITSVSWYEDSVLIPYCSLCVLLYCLFFWSWLDILLVCIVVPKIAEHKWREKPTSVRMLSSKTPWRQQFSSHYIYMNHEKYVLLLF